MIVGASFDDDLGSHSGAAFIFDLANDVWTETQKITANDGAPDDSFGRAVSVHGDRVLVGAWEANTSIADTGAAYIFELDNGSWIQVDKLIPSDVFDKGNFGIDVVLQNQWAMVGASGDDEIANSSGAVYVFEFTNNTWSELQKLFPATGSVFDRFGLDIDLDGNRFIAGSATRDTAGIYSGSVFSYEYNGVNWSFDQELTASDARANDFYGNAVAVSGNRVIAGAPGDDNNWVDDGAAYITNIANRYDIIINVTGLYERVTIGDSSRSPNRVTFTNAGDSVEFIGGVTPTQLIISNLADDEPYELIYGGDPTSPNQFCTYDPGSAPTTGVINDADVVVSMSCDYYEYALSVNGEFLAPGTSAVVSNQIGEQITVNSGEVVSFPTLLDDGSVYQLTVDTQPSSPSQTCTLFNDGYYWMQAATIDFLICEIDQFSIGGMVSGLLPGNQLVLQNEGADDLVITEDGEFTFATLHDDLSTFNVSISQQPQGGPIQTCNISNEEGSLSGENFTNVLIDCPQGNDLIFAAGFED